MKIEHPNAYTFGPRKVIRVGTLIRTRISSSSGPVYRGKEPQGERGVFSITAIEVKGRRVHVEAIDVHGGRTVTLYLAGPNYKSPAPSTVVKPYKFTITSADVEKRKKAKAKGAAAGRRAAGIAKSGGDRRRSKPAGTSGEAG